MPCPWDTQFSAFHFPLLLFCGVVEKKMVQEIILSRSLRSPLFQLSFSCLLDFTNDSFLPLDLRWNFKKAKYTARPAGLLLWPCPHQLSARDFAAYPVNKKPVSAAEAPAAFLCFYTSIAFWTVVVTSRSLLHFLLLVKWLWWLLLNHVKTRTWEEQHSVCTTALLNLAA